MAAAVVLRPVLDLASRVHYAARGDPDRFRELADRYSRAVTPRRSHAQARES